MIVKKKGQNESAEEEVKGQLTDQKEAKMGASTSKVEDLNEFTKRRKEEFPDDNDKEKKEEDNKKEEKGEEIDIAKSSDEDDVTEVSPVIERTKKMGKYLFCFCISAWY